jgi:acyl-CoA thioester hydrolase
VEPNLLSEFPVIIKQAVAWGDMDSYRHVNNAIYFRYFENARVEYFRRMDWFAYEEATGIGPILAATQARFRKPLAYPDQIQVGVRIIAIDSDRFTMEYRLICERLQATAAEGQGTIVIFHYPSGEKVALPAELRRRIEVIEASVKPTA